MSECREGSNGYFASQSLRVQQGDRDPVTVFEVPTLGPLPVLFPLCRIFGEIKSGDNSVFAGALQRIGVTPDGSGVVFEVTDDFSIIAANLAVPSEREGIYYVRADGTGLRRLGPASRQPNFRLMLNLTSPSGFSGNQFPFFGFSPDGRTIAFTDIGVGPAGEEATQIFTQDIQTGERRQITRLPFAKPKDGLDDVVGPPFYIGGDTIEFASDANPDALNPERSRALFVVNANGSDLRLSASFADVALPTGTLQPRFSITGSGRVAGTIFVPGVPLDQASRQIAEVFVDDGINLLQLTNLRRSDTGNTGLFVTVDGQRVIFTASADPFNTNPAFGCQVFSIDVLGTGLRQLTHFDSGEASIRGCNAFPGAGCLVGVDGNGFAPNQDARTGAVIVDSSCDDSGNDLAGEQLFAMNPDGGGLRQITHTRGMTTSADGTVNVELPGPDAYGPYQ